MESGQQPWFSVITCYYMWKPIQPTSKINTEAGEISGGTFCSISYTFDTIRIEYSLLSFNYFPKAAVLCNLETFFSKSSQNADLNIYCNYNNNLLSSLSFCQKYLILHGPAVLLPASQARAHSTHAVAVTKDQESFAEGKVELLFVIPGANDPRYIAKAKLFLKAVITANYWSLFQKHFINTTV